MTRLRSPLTQRLQRHTRVAIIQRAVLGAETPFLGNIIPPKITGTPSSEPVSSREPANITRAVILPPNTDLPAGQITPFVADEQQNAPEHISPIQRTPQPQSVMPQPKASETLKPILSAAEPESQNKGWNLLQTIFNRHQEKKGFEKTETDTIQRDNPTIGMGAGSGVEAESTPSQTASTPGAEPSQDIDPTTPAEPSPGNSNTPGADAGVTGSSQTGGNSTVGGNLTVGGSSLVGGSSTVGGSSMVGGGSVVGGDSTVGSSAISGGILTSGGNLSASGNITAGSSLKSEGDTSAGANIKAGAAKISGNLQAGADFHASKSNIEGTLNVGSNLTTLSSIKPTGDVNVGSNITAGKNIESVGDTNVGGNVMTTKIQAAGDVSVSGNAQPNTIQSAGNVNVGSNATIGAKLQSSGGAEIGGSAQVGGTIQSGGELSVGGSLTVGGNANIGGSISAGGPVTIAGTSNVSPGGTGGGAVQPKRVEEPAQTSPLQDAWPVQRRPDPQLEAPIVMQNAIPGQASDSPIEIVPPRRPRPQGAPTLIQRTPDLQAATKPKRLGSLLAEEAPVSTEIGPLPQDLWHLIGQNPPQQKIDAPSKGEKTLSRKADKPLTTPKGEIAQPTSGHPPEAGKSVLEPPSTLIQRTALGSEASSDESDSDEESPELDTDELARKVYAEIKRRLTTEWERFRNLL